MYFQALTGEWRFRQGDQDEWLPARVPGSVHLDLMALNRIPDPAVSDNEKHVQWVSESDWEYTREFTVEPGLLQQSRIFLVCEGLDTIAEVSINGTLVGSSQNMFRHYRWDVQPLLREGTNQITVLLRSPINYITEKQNQRYLICGLQSVEGGTHLRKSAYHFGWDWGPQLPSIGIWQDIRLEGRSHARLSDVHLRQRHQDSGVKVSAHLTLDRWDSQPLEACLRITTPGGAVQSVRTNLDAGQVDLEIQINNPQLWWPNGYGAQPLYQVEVELLQAELLVDRRLYKVGLRTLELRQEPDLWGRSFTFVVNGVPIFAKGSNWIPAESFFTRITELTLDHFIRSAADSHQNMLRVWGGGYYEDERFYDLCDRYGLLVWQDFMFACGIYPLGEESFLADVRQEVAEAARYLRHRACMALWCGNNEMEWGWTEWGWDLPAWQSLKEDYLQFFHKILPEILAGEDPDTPYWPSSPSSNTPFINPNGTYQGDAHYWEVWHGRKPFSAYKDQYPRFMSEFGFQSLPPFETVKTFAPPEEWNLTSYTMEYHQRSPQGNGLIVTQLAEHYQMPKDFPSWCYLSMVLQAEGIRFGVEHWRRNKKRVSGTLYWQLNDCWPVVSWSSIDYYGRWKALHYAAKRFYAPVMVSIDKEEDSLLHIHVTSDLREEWTGELAWSLQDLDGNIFDSGREAVCLEPGESRRVLRWDGSSKVTAQNRRSLIFTAQLLRDGQLVSRSLETFSPDKHLLLKDPQITTRLAREGQHFTCTLSAHSLARFVELKISGYDLVFSDNYFDLPAGETATVTFQEKTGLSIEEAKASLQVISLFDSYAPVNQLET